MRSKLRSTATLAILLPLFTLTIFLFIPDLTSSFTNKKFYFHFLIEEGEGSNITPVPHRCCIIKHDKLIPD